MTTPSTGATTRPALHAPPSGTGVRAGPSFWTGPWGVVVTVLVFAVLCALLVGWVMAWAGADGGPRVVWLVLGPLAFSAVLVSLTMLFWSLRSAERLRRAETTFVTGASHNLRTPLSAIRAAAQTLTSPGIGETDRYLLLDAILHETARLELRIDNLLETARLAFERAPYAAGLATIDLGALVREVHDDARWAFTAQGGAYEVVLPDEQLFVTGDLRALRLLLENLVDNALKYSEAAPSVTTVVERQGGHGVVKVKDRGVGFAPERATALIERPDQGDVRRRGAGLGLRLARSIARAHGGELAIESDGPGKGAIAELSLPLDEDGA